MHIKGIDHISINTVDFPKTIHFYRDILGFEEMNTVVRDDVVGTYLQIPGGGRMEIFDNLGKTKRYPIGELDNGIRHIAFTVEDVTENARQLTENGVELYLPPTELPEFGVRTNAGL